MIAKRCVVLVAAGVALNAIAAEPAAPPADEDSRATTRAAGTQTEANPAVLQATARTDRLELDTTVVTGNRELPKVLYIVPWKKADLGELPAQPFNTLLDEVLTPVDRDVFRREVTYYEAVSGANDGAPAPTSAPAARPEK